MLNLPPFKLERYFAKYEFNTEFLLCSSDSESMSVADLLALEPGAAEKFQQVWLGYTESQGSLALRAEICKLYETIRPDDLVVHSGAQEAILLFMLAVFRPCEQNNPTAISLPAPSRNDFSYLPSAGILHLITACLKFYVYDQTRSA